MLCALNYSRCLVHEEGGMMHALCLHQWEVISGTLNQIPSCSLLLWGKWHFFKKNTRAFYSSVRCIFNQSWQYESRGFQMYFPCVLEVEQKILYTSQFVHCYCRILVRIVAQDGM